MIALINDCIIRIIIILEILGANFYIYPFHCIRLQVIKVCTTSKHLAVAGIAPSCCLLLPRGEDQTSSNKTISQHVLLRSDHDLTLYVSYCNLWNRSESSASVVLLSSYVNGEILNVGLKVREIWDDDAFILPTQLIDSGTLHEQCT